MRVYNTIHEAYLGTLADVLDNPDYICSPRGLKIYEKVDYQFRISCPEAVSPITMDLDRNEVIARYAAKEHALYESGTNSVDDFITASKFWKNLANVDGSINSAYGYLIFKNKSHGHGNFELAKKQEDGTIIWPTVTELREGKCLRTPWEWCLQSLKTDKDTRQAVMRFSLPEHFYLNNKDMTCTLSGNFLIREDKLHLSMVMRSNDVVKGLTYDATFFISLLDKMLIDLKDTYPDLQKGTYTHIVHSLHAYSKDIETIKKMLGRT